MDFNLRVLILMALIALPLSAYGLERPSVERNLDFIAGPTLLSPVTDDIDLKGKPFLEFKWLQERQVMTDHYEFKLYEGYEETSGSLVFKKDFAPNEPIRIPVSFFKEGRTYTWVLIQVFLGGKKSDPSRSPFKVVKK